MQSLSTHSSWCFTAFYPPAFFSTYGPSCNDDTSKPPHLWRWMFSDAISLCTKYLNLYNLFKISFLRAIQVQLTPCHQDPCKNSVVFSVAKAHLAASLGEKASGSVILAVQTLDPRGRDGQCNARKKNSCRVRLVLGASVPYFLPVGVLVAMNCGSGRLAGNQRSEITTTYMCTHGYLREWVWRLYHLQTACFQASRLKY